MGLNWKIKWSPPLHFKSQKMNRTWKTTNLWGSISTLWKIGFWASRRMEAYRLRRDADVQCSSSHRRMPSLRRALVETMVYYAPRIIQLFVRKNGLALAKNIVKYHGELGRPSPRHSGNSTMSIIKNIEVELSDLVKDSNLILEVDYIEPFVEELAVKSTAPNVSPPPFKKQGAIFTVTSVLKNVDKIEIPKTIRVPNEGWRRSLSQHKTLYAGGVSKSYGVKQYKTTVKSMRSATILFLHHFQGSFELEGKNSFESVTALDKIMMLLKAK